jgi:hypothetical protein
MGKSPSILESIVSGGQSGVDRAALDAAIELSMPCGGWCPRGRKAEDGALPEKYPLRETPSDEYEQRTEWNVRDSDATLILTRGRPTGGTAYTVLMAKRLAKPYMVVDFDEKKDTESVRKWILFNGIRILNVAGPRSSKDPGIYNDAIEFIRTILKNG